MEVVIDRFEGDYAIVEVGLGQFVLLPKILVSSAKEGDVINITINKKRTSQKEQKILELMSNLFED